MKQAKQQWFKTELAKVSMVNAIWIMGVHRMLQGPCGRCAAEKVECIMSKGIHAHRCQRCIKRKTRCSYLLPSSIMELYKTPPDADELDEVSNRPSFHIDKPEMNGLNST